MNDFTYHIPTVICFGRDQVSRLAGMTESGKNVLLVYGGGSIRRSGLYDRVMAVLNGAGLTVTELSGVEPNPRINTVRRGVALCHGHDIHMVLAVGGGSSIDCAKIIAAGACYDGDPWDLVLDRTKIQAALPIYSVLTLAATGSEMDHFAVISDPEKREKWGTNSPYLKPRLSVLEPELTCSVPAIHTAAGAADIMSHTLENYFTRVEGAYLQASLCEALLKTVIRYAPIAVAQPENYEARANLMWASSLAINGLVSLGAEVTWCVHPIEHELSAFYDITHGVGLAILTPVWMEFALREDTTGKFAAYGRSVFGITEEDDMEAAKAAIRATREFFTSIGLPATLTEVGIDATYFDIMAQKAARRCPGSFVPLTEADIKTILTAAL